MFTEKNDFVGWLRGNLEERDWSYQDLADRAGLSKGGVGVVMSQRQGPGIEFCRGVARAFRLDPVDVLRLAGLLPGEPGETEDPTLREWWEFGKTLTPEQREEAILDTMLHFRTNLKERRRLLEEAGVTTLATNDDEVFS